MWVRNWPMPTEWILTEHFPRWVIRRLSACTSVPRKKVKSNGWLFDITIRNQQAFNPKLSTLFTKRLLLCSTGTWPSYWKPSKACYWRSSFSQWAISMTRTWNHSLHVDLYPCHCPAHYPLYQKDSFSGNNGVPQRSPIAGSSVD